MLLREKGCLKFKDFSSLVNKYGVMCKNLVENPEQRTNFWEAKGNTKFK